MKTKKHISVNKHLDIQSLLQQILLNLREILGEKLVGLYLYGSMVVGDFDYEISDIDLLAATKTLIDKNEYVAIKKMHDFLAKENPSWDNRIEVQYASLDALRTFKTKKSKIANISSGEPFHLIDAGDEWLLNWYFVRENSITLFGVPPENIIEPISKTEFIKAVREQAFERFNDLEKSMNSKNYQSYLILTMCRALYAIEKGEQVSKRKAANWVKTKLPEFSDLIENAFIWRATPFEKNSNHEASFPESKEFIQYIIQIIKDK